MKFVVAGQRRAARRRSPCGERGLKLSAASATCTDAESLPVRGAWVEISDALSKDTRAHVAPRAGSVG